MNLLDSKILEDSSSYHLLKEMVSVDLGRTVLIAMAKDAFGGLSEAQISFIEDIRDYDHLLDLCKKMRRVTTWDELVAP